MDYEKIEQKILDWITKKNTENVTEKITPDTPILEKRIVSSLQLMDLILFIESIKGSPVDVTKIKEGTFRSVRSIVNSLLIEE